MLADSTNVERPGYTMSESTVGESFEKIFLYCKRKNNSSYICIKYP